MVLAGKPVSAALIMVVLAGSCTALSALAQVEAQPMPAPPTTPATTGDKSDKPVDPVGSTPTVADPKDTHASDKIRFGPFSEPIDVKVLVEMIQSHLNIQIISTDQALRDKKIVLPNYLEIERDKLIPFLSAMLDQNGQMLVQDPGGFYTIGPVTNFVPPAPGPLSNTRVISTMGLKPTSLQTAIGVALRATGATGGAGTGPIAYLDDLGVVVMTDTPRRIDSVIEVIRQLALEQIGADITRYDLKHIAAPVAKIRLLELVGQFTRALSTGNPGDPNIQAQQNPGTNTSNLSQRIIIDPTGNSLLFRGRLDERSLIEKLLPFVDAPNQLIPKFYEITGAVTLAEHASRQGLGEVRIMRSTRDGSTGNGSGSGVFNNTGINNPNNTFSTNSSGTDIGGSVIIIDPQARGFMYYGTAEQHARIAKLVDELKDALRTDEIVYEFYKLKHANAKDTASLIRDLISNQVSSGGREGSILPGSTGRNNNTNTTRRPTTPNPTSVTTSGDSLGEIVASDDVFVTADERNNQLVVKAPRRIHPQFDRLIQKLDIRRAQVYLDVKIVDASANDSVRLAIESQLINANGTGGVIRSSWAGSPASGSVGTNPASILTAPIVAGTLGSPGGIVAALIKSDQVPLVLTAIAKDTTSRLIASPQILVDDNEEAEVSSTLGQPTTTQTQNTTGQPTTSFSGFEKAGPKLTVKPQISSGDYLRLKYSVELSNFQGTVAAGSSVPPAKQESTIKADSVTIPSDATIVVGGLTQETDANTVNKVPFFGDIPIVGQLFRDDSKEKNRRAIYVFITPRIMRDVNFQGPKVNTYGPLAAMKINDPLPEAKPVFIDIANPMTPTSPQRLDPGPSGWQGPTSVKPLEEKKQGAGN
jgi:type II secretory pathway component GspD/PulD (secretin)